MVPIKREPGGLAMSSRNVRLSDNGRKKAAFINESLMRIKNSFKEVGIPKSVDMAKSYIEEFEHAELDYLIIVGVDTLKETEQHQNQKIIALIALDYEEVRLLDNRILN